MSPITESTAIKTSEDAIIVELPYDHSCLSVCQFVACLVGRSASWSAVCHNFLKRLISFLSLDLGS